MTDNSLFRRLLPALLFVGGLMVMMTVTVQAQPAEAMRQIGTIEELQQDAGYIVISGNRYQVADGRTVVYYEQRQLALHHLDVGMVVGYTVSQGLLTRIEILGPAEKMRQREQT